MKPRSRLLFSLIAGISLAMSACGGGSGNGASGSGSPLNRPVGSVSDGDGAANSVSESAVFGTAVGVSLRAVDPDSGDTVSYSLVDSAGGRFAVSASTGVVTVAGPLDFEQEASHTIRGRARSSDGTQSESDFTIEIVDDTQEVVLRTSFPATSPSATVHFSGSAIDISGTIVGPPGETLEVLVETGAFSTPAVIDIDGRWRAQDVPLNPATIGLTTVSIAASSQSGKSAQTTVTVSTAAMLSSPHGIAIDPTRGRAIIVDPVARALMSVDLATGERSVVSGVDRGTGPSLGLFPRLALNPASNTAYLWRSSQVLAVDLVSGDRTVFSDAATGTGPVPQQVFGDIVVDTGANRLLVAGGTEVISVDLVTGNRTLVSGSGLGAGPAFGTLRGIAVRNSSQALVTDSNARVLLVNLGNGNRSVVSSDTMGAGPALNGSLRIAADPQNNRALVASQEFGTYIYLLAVDLGTGNRTEVSGTRGTGVHVGNPYGIALDAQSNRALIADEIGASVVAIDMSTGDRTILSGNNVGDGERRFRISKVNLDFDNNRILAGSRDEPVLYSIDLRSARKSVLFDDSDGTGPAVGSFNMAILDKPNNRMLARSGIGLFSMDLSSGNRTLLSDPDTVNGPSLGSIRDMTLDSPANRILAVEEDDRLNPTLLEIDLSTGLRATLSGPALGGGPGLVQPRSVVLDMPMNRVLVADQGAIGVLAIDLATGNRSFVSDPANMFSASAVAIDDTSRRLFALHYSHALVEIDELTGARTEISGPNVGSGLAYGLFTDLVLDMPNNRAFVGHDNGSEILVVDLVSGDRVVFAR